MLPKRDSTFINEPVEVDFCDLKASAYFGGKVAPIDRYGYERATIQ